MRPCFLTGMNSSDLLTLIFEVSFLWWYFISESRESKKRCAGIDADWKTWWQAESLIEIPTAQKIARNLGFKVTVKWLNNIYNNRRKEFPLSGNMISNHLPSFFPSQLFFSLFMMLCVCLWRCHCRLGVHRTRHPHLRHDNGLIIAGGP